MTAEQLLDHLRDAGVIFTPEGDKLSYLAPPGALSDDLRAAMRAHKAELLAMLEAGTGPGSPPVPTPAEVGTASCEVSPGETVRIPLDDLIFGDFLERNRLRIVDGEAYPDGRNFRPTLYLASLQPASSRPPIS